MSLLKYLFPIFALLLFIMPAVSRAGTLPPDTELSGRLLSAENGVPVAYASISLVTVDDRFVAGEISDESGRYRFVAIEAGTYRLRIEHLEFTPHTTEPFSLVEGEPFRLPDVTLTTATQELGEVLVTARKALVEVRADKLVFNVDASPSASGLNGLDLLRRAPGVRLDFDNNVTLLGKGNVLIYLNGRPTQLRGADLANFLESMTSDNVEAIEIIANPGAQYEASGEGIINIRTKRNEAVGFKGSVNANFSQGEYLRSAVGLSLNYGGENLRVNLNVTQSANDRFDHFRDDKIQRGRLLTLNSREVYEPTSTNAGFGLETRLAKNHLLNFSANAVLSENGSFLSSTTDILSHPGAILDRVLISEKTFREEADNLNLNLSHRWTVDERTTWTTTVSWGEFGKEGRNRQPNVYFGPDRETILSTEDRTFTNATGIDLWSAKTDLERSWESLTVATGLGYVSVTSANDFRYFTRDNEIETFAPERSNDFNYVEDVLSAYASLQLKLGKQWDLSAGLRMESTRSRGLLTTVQAVENQDVKRRYVDFFPNLGLNYRAGDDHRLSLSLGRRITRPNYQDLNPFETPMSQLVFWKGNPFLQPRYTTNYQLNYAYRGKLTLAVNYGRTRDFFANLMEIVGEVGNQIIPRNLERATTLGFSLSYPVQVTEHWDFVGFADANFRAYSGSPEGIDIDESVDNYTLRVQNNVQLPGGILLDLTGRVSSDWIWRGSIRVRGNATADFGLRKKLFGDRLQLRLTGSDIFGTNRDFFYSGDYGGLEVDGVVTFDNQRFGAGLTYNFGNQKAKTKRSGEEGLEEALRRIGK